MVYICQISGAREWNTEIMAVWKFGMMECWNNGYSLKHYLPTLPIFQSSNIPLLLIPAFQSSRFDTPDCRHLITNFGEESK